MKKFLVAFACLLFVQFSYAQFYVKGAALVNSIDKDLKDLDIYKGKASYCLGIGQEMAIARVLVFDLGFNFYQLKQELNVTNQVATNNLVGVPIMVKLRPIKILDFGVGLMPSISISKDESIFDKVIDLSAMGTITFNPIKKIGIEAGYTTGFLPYNTIEITDNSGNVIKQFDNNASFYSLGLKIRI
jgi:hypothetical protein